MIYIVKINLKIQSDSISFFISVYKLNMNGEKEMKLW